MDETIREVLVAIRSTVRARLYPWNGSIGTLDEDDLVQIVVLDLLKDGRRALANYDPKVAKLSTYIARHTNFRVTDVVRKHLRRYGLGDVGPTAEDSPYEPTNGTTPEDWAAFAHFELELIASVDKLSPRYRQLFELSFVESRSNEEVAELMGVRTAEVASMRCHVRSALRAKATKLGLAPKETGKQGKRKAGSAGDKT